MPALVHCCPVGHVLVALLQVVRQTPFTQAFPPVQGVLAEHGVLLATHPLTVHTVPDGQPPPTVPLLQGVLDGEQVPAGSQT